LTFVGFGKAHPKVTADKDFRRALGLAIARGGLESVGTGERVEPTADPLPVDLGGVALADGARGADLRGAEAALDKAADRVSALKSAARASLELEILVDRSRFDDRDAADKLVVALDKLGIGAKVTELDAGAFDDRVRDGDCDLWIGQLPATGADPAVLWGAVFAAGGDGWAKAQLATGAIDAAEARKQFAARLPLIPLYHRALRVHHRTDVRGVALDACGRIGLADLFVWGSPSRSKGKK
jgi:ABC-type oligopeptide transport system substrate-binding subunit